MAARFRQIASFDGVDEGAGPLDAAAIVPFNDSSLVFQEGGPDLHVTSDAPSQVVLTESTSFSDGDLHSSLSDLGANAASIGAALRSGAKRHFRVSGRALAGKKGVVIRAKTRARGTLETQLQAIVLRAKPMKVSLRQIQVFAHEARKTHDDIQSRRV
jgi:hypothetical protein